MKKCKNLILIKLLMLLVVTPAYAYLDPGTGSMLLQGLLAGLMVIGGVIGVYWRRLKSFFSRFNSKKKEVGESDES